MIFWWEYGFVRYGDISCWVMFLFSFIRIEKFSCEFFNLYKILVIFLMLWIWGFKFNIVLLSDIGIRVFLEVGMIG